ncbi:phosphoesterase family-domain-containing protein [Vararia minispora EC-137]|uniref:Phosphoesterase family-domain-containing protein n=1 Tax=Vararia minispora EC-137 TaxID=1314806 RepID=A0ACB8QPM6_9AGAM|nr:phosphoesterase family-domain-containing protein [Vararia minispora EC-137]
MFTSVAAVAAVFPVAWAASAFNFAPPSTSPTAASANYTGSSNGTLSNSPVVSGRAFDRFIQIWLENTDFNAAASTGAFMELAKQGITLDQYYALTHPSEPNYIATVGGDFFGLFGDEFIHIPSNVSTVVDLLEAKNISWASYQENMPTVGYFGYNYTSVDYLDAGADNYTFYVRKHNPTMIYDSVANVSSRVARHRNFNDFAADVNASALPQWMFVTPNIVNDAHDTTIDFAAQWLQFWLMPLLNDTRFNDNRTLILLTFDESETYTVNNRIFTLLLGGAVPSSLKGTTDSTYYTHYSALSTVQANWGLSSLGRGDTNKTMSNVYSLVANVTGYQNENVTGAAIPLTNLTGTIPGPLNVNAWFPFTAPNTSAVGAGNGTVFVAPGVNMNLTIASAPQPINLTQRGQSLPQVLPLNATSLPSSVVSNTSTSGASTMRVASTGVLAVAGAVFLLF